MIIKVLVGSVLVHIGQKDILLSYGTTGRGIIFCDVSRSIVSQDNRMADVNEC